MSSNIDNTDTESKISNENDTKPKSSNTDSASKKSASGSSKASSSSLRPTKTTHIYKNDKSLKSIPILKDTKDALVLYLQNNCIKKIENLDSFVNLTHLYLQWNSIKTIENLDPLKNLNKLYLEHNEINVIENLEGLEKLTELHIGKQNFGSGEVMVFEPRCMDVIRSTLTLLNISGNRLTDLEAIMRMQSLTILVAKDNNIKDLSSMVYNLSCLGNLKEVYLTGNPIAKMPHYKESIIAKCRSLEVIDGQAISEQTRDFVNRLDNRRTSLLNVKEEEERTKRTKSKVPMTNRKSESPNAHLMQLEAKRLAAARSRELRMKQLDCSKGQVPRCFWRNVASERVKEYVNQPSNEDGNTNNNYNVGFNNTSTIVWP